MLVRAAVASSINISFLTSSPNECRTITFDFQYMSECIESPSTLLQKYLRCTS